MTYTKDSGFDPLLKNAKGVWIGFSGQQVGGSTAWAWEHAGSITTYTNWALTEPGYMVPKTCTYLALDGLWYSTSCNDKLSYICKASKITELKPDHRGDYTDCDEENEWFQSSDILEDGTQGNGFK